MTLSDIKALTPARFVRGCVAIMLAATLCWLAVTGVEGAVDAIVVLTTAIISFYYGERKANGQGTNS